MEVLRETAPEVAEAFVAMRGAIDASGPLDEKVRSLVACAAFVATNNEAGFRSHAHRAVAAGATRAELVQTILITLGFTQGIAPVAQALGWIDQADGPSGSLSSQTSSKRSNF